MKQRVVSVVRERYLGINYTHLTELLAEREGIVLSRSNVRRLLVGAGLPGSRHRCAPRHRCRRQRMPQEGMLLQLDGSHHAWLEGRGPMLTMLLAVDDATGTVPYALFRDREDTRGYLLLLQGVIRRRGIPLAVYIDRHAVFQRRYGPEDVPVLGNGASTQCGRALRELGVTQVFAHSPEAKGRIERVSGTLQDRLVAELRLAGVSCLEKANEVLWDFLPRFNKRFGVPSAQPGSAYREVPEELDIDGVLCIKELRHVAKDNTVRYQGHTLQLFPDADRASYAGARVEVQERLDGRLLVNCHGKLLTQRKHPLSLPHFEPWPLHILWMGIWQCRRTWTCLPQFLRSVQRPTSGASAWAGMGDWYQDDSKKCVHRELVRAGMKEARLRGKRIGRPKVTEQEGFLPRFEAVVERIGTGGISRRQAAKELDIGYATLKRLLDAPLQSSVRNGGTSSLVVTICGEGDIPDDVLATPLTKSLNR